MSCVGTLTAVVAGHVSFVLFVTWSIFLISDSIRMIHLENIVLGGSAGQTLSGVDFGEQFHRNRIGQVGMLNLYAMNSPCNFYKTFWPL